MKKITAESTTKKMANSKDLNSFSPENVGEYSDSEGEEDSPQENQIIEQELPADTESPENIPPSGNGSNEESKSDNGINENSPQNHFALNNNSPLEESNEKNSTNEVMEEEENDGEFEEFDEIRQIPSDDFQSGNILSCLNICIEPPHPDYTLQLQVDSFRSLVLVMSLLFLLNKKFNY